MNIIFTAKMLKSPTMDIMESCITPAHRQLNIFERAAQIFALPKYHRTEDDKQFLIEAMSQVAYFQTSHNGYMDHEEYLEKCCSLMNIETFEDKDAIFHYGEIGRKFYVILDGTVDIYIPKTPHEIKDDLIRLEKEIINSRMAGSFDILALTSRIKQQLTEGKELNLFTMLLAHDSNPDLEVNDEGPTLEMQPVLKRRVLRGRTHKSLASAWQTIGEFNFCDREHLEIFSRFPNHRHYIESGIFKYKKVRQLVAGDSFGELALTTNKVRTATAVAIGRTKLISLSKQDYKSLFETKIKKTYAKYNFFKNYFTNCATESISKFAFNFQEKKFKYGQKLYSQGEEPKELFVIVKGEVQLTIKEEGEKCKIRSNLNDQALETNAFKKINLVNLGPGAFVGEEEILKNTKRMATAISISCDTLVYSLLVEEFKNLRNRHADLIVNLQEIMETKALYRKERLKDIQKVKEIVKSSSIDLSSQHKKTILDIKSDQMNLNEELKALNYRFKNDENILSAEEGVKLNEISEDRSKSLKKIVNIGKEYYQKYRLYSMPQSNHKSEKKEQNSTGYISSKQEKDYSQSKCGNPLEMIESKLKFIKAHEEYFLPFDMETPLFEVQNAVSPTSKNENEVHKNITEISNTNREIDSDIKRVSRILSKYPSLKAKYLKSQNKAPILPLKAKNIVDMIENEPDNEFSVAKKINNNDFNTPTAKTIHLNFDNSWQKFSSSGKKKLSGLSSNDETPIRESTGANTRDKSKLQFISKNMKNMNIQCDIKPIELHPDKYQSNNNALPINLPRVIDLENIQENANPNIPNEEDLITNQVDTKKFQADIVNTPIAKNGTNKSQFTPRRSDGMAFMTQHENSSNGKSVSAKKQKRSSFTVNGLRAPEFTYSIINRNDNIKRGNTKH